MKLTKSRLEQIIKEEFASILNERGFGESASPGDEWGKKQTIEEEELEEKKKGMFDQPDFKSKVAWVKRNRPNVKDPDAYVAGALRKTGEIK